MNSISRMNPATLPDFGQQGFSQISIAEPGRIAYISGQVAWTPEGTPLPSDLVEQIHIAGANARKALEAISATMQDVVMARVYVTDLTEERLQRVMDPLRKIFDGAQPSLTGIGVAALAGQGLQVELELVVRLPD
ncbi:RidA family protein [Rhizobium sp. ARZ01]|uniref:RidA family protein n=1 Tax=Rhizobium sp. ARZ01 TaxID=2769313 RepID=UPI00177B725E|nr:RidA family protein [Rhizobium sp. ARZ01]MBD9375636.1 RidA family protein [Rhizobium sp. ARZ01]